MFDKVYLQRTYANMVGPRLEKFTVQQHVPYRANFRCPICGDSQKNKYRKRGFLLEKEGSMMFYCHNECGSMNFEKFLDEHHHDLYVDYKFELIQEWAANKRQEEAEAVAPIPIVQVEVSDMDDVSDSYEVPEAIQYLGDRKIPKKFWDDIHYTDHFFQYVNSKLEDKFPPQYNKKIDRRVIFPLRDEHGEIFGVIGRSVEQDSNLRYMTIKFDESKPKIFGLDRLDRSKHAYVVEGPIDSFFVDNCIALAGTDGSPNEVFDSSSQYTMILDNQPRHPSVIKKYEKYIRMGCRLMIWPTNMVGKDINDLILDGMTQSELMELIKSNSYEGFQLHVMFNQWRKV